MFRAKNFEPYFKVLRESNKASWIEEERATESRTGFKRMQDDHYKQLEISCNKENDTLVNLHKKLHGIYNYDILSNPAYARKFHYIPCEFKEDRQQFIIS